jgi:hypothetical protein
LFSSYFEKISHTIFLIASESVDLSNQNVSITYFSNSSLNLSLEVSNHFEIKDLAITFKSSDQVNSQVSLFNETVHFFQKLKLYVQSSFCSTLTDELLSEPLLLLVFVELFRFFINLSNLFQLKSVLLVQVITDDHEPSNLASILLTTIATSSFVQNLKSFVSISSFFANVNNAS